MDDRGGATNNIHMDRKILENDKIWLHLSPP